MIRTPALILAIIVLLPLTDLAEENDLYRYPRGTVSLKGVVIKVVSAGELVLWEKGNLHPFRLYGISLPDSQSPRGQNAKKKVSDMIFNTLLDVHLLSDESPTPSGVVIIRGNCLNKTLVHMGLAEVDDSCRVPEFCDQWKAAQKKPVTKSLPTP